MIYDRTQTDVDNAISIRENKVQKFIEPTTAEKVTLERGLLTINTLNRIENKQKSLKGLFNKAGYYPNVTSKTWVTGGIFRKEDFQRIIDNEKSLVNSFYVFDDTPNVPEVSSSYKDLNSIEKILYDLDLMYTKLQINWLKCGTIQCGEADVL